MQILDRSAKDMILFSCGRVCCLITLLYQYLDLSLRPESHILLRLLLLGEIQNDFAAFGYLFLMKSCATATVPEPHPLGSQAHIPSLSWEFFGDSDCPQRLARYCCRALLDLLLKPLQDFSQLFLTEQ